MRPELNCYYQCTLTFSLAILRPMRPAHGTRGNWDTDNRIKGRRKWVSLAMTQLSERSLKVPLIFSTTLNAEPHQGGSSW